MIKRVKVGHFSIHFSKNLHINLKPKAPAHLSTKWAETFRKWFSHLKTQNWGVSRWKFELFCFWASLVQICPMWSWALTLATIALVFKFWCNLRCRMMCFSSGQKLATSPGLLGTCLDVSNVVLGTYFSHHCTCFWILMWFDVSHDVF